MSTFASLPRLTVEKYLALERGTQDTRGEFYDGAVVAMAGASRNHELLVARLVRLIDAHLDHKPCSVTGSNLKVWIPAENAFVYPDASVAGDPVVYRDDEQDAVTNPILIVEVLSPSTEKRDRQTKFRAYKSIPSFREYVLVSQGEPFIEVLSRTGEGFWRHNESAGLASTIHLTSIDLELPLSAIYDRVQFPL